MVGHAADAAAVGVVRIVAHSKLFRHGRDDRPEDVGAEHAGHALQAGRCALQAHSGVDVLLGQRLELPRSHPVELGEDQVPDLHLFGAVAVIEDLRAGTADAVGTVRRRAGGPEVVILAHPRDPAGRYLDLVMPDVVRLVVVKVHRDRQAVGRDLEDLQQQLPRPVDRLALEVVAEAEVAQHLEERLVERRLAHILDVASADALLASRRAAEARVAQTHELALELVHPRRCEKHRRIIRHQHVARPANAALGGEKIEISFAKFVGRHSALSLVLCP